MAKKKKKQQRDARGYQQGGTPAAPPQLAGASNKTASKTATKVTANVHQTIQELLDLLLMDDKPPIPLTEGTVDARFVQRIGTLYDRLLGFGFLLDQIKLCVGSVGANVSLESALDWLCLHINTSDLPPLFTEGLVRDAEITSAANNGNTKFDVLIALGAAADGVSSEREPIVFDEPILPQAKEAVAVNETHEEVAAQKAWLLAQYQYEEDDIAEEHEIPENGVVTVENALLGEEPVEDTKSAPVDERENELSETVTDKTEPIETEPTPDEVRLGELKQQLEELEADASNDASNYMRSKHEIKDIQRQVKQMRQQVAGLERKMERQRKESANDTLVEVLAPAKTQATENDDEPGLFSIFDESVAQNETNPKVANSRTENEPDVRIPEDSIPENWTGSTPKLYLEGWCRKEKLPKPIFRKTKQSGCHLRVRLGKTTVIQMEINGSDYKDAQQYVSVLALYQISPALPLYRMFPPFYRDVWRSWLDEEREKQNDQDAGKANQRAKVVDELIGCIPVAQATKSRKPATNKAAVVAVETVNAPLESWDDADVDDAEIDVSSQVRKSSKAATATISPTGRRLKVKFLQRQESTKYQTMLDVRKNLPIFSFQESILETIRTNSVTILCAETGSGKTTQCSSYVLEQALRDGKGDQTSILCTQPRRVATISVAERVAEELGEPSIGKLVGYQIRMEAKRSSETRLLFCTTGVVLRRLIEDPTLTGISHVVCDEVHERQWQIDVLLVSLRTLLSGARPDLKVILMSATLDTKLFGAFFHGAPIVNVPGRTFPVSTYYLEDLLQGTNHMVEETSRYARRDFSRRETVSMYVTGRGGQKRRETADYEVNEDVSDDFPEYNLATRKSMDRVDETVVNYDLIEDVLTALFQQNTGAFVPPGGEESTSGAVLVFLPGIGEIRTLMDRLSGSRFFKNSQNFEIVPMHSTLSSNDQRRAFRPSPKGCRKVILSTNIAETSVTIPDVVYVIDSGRVREIQRDKRTGTRKLVSTWCSRASAKQRAGRAGRVQSGVCLKLYSSRTERRTMNSDSEPELKRIPLEEVCLTILAGKFTKSCGDFLRQTPQPPSEDAIHAALKVLEDIGAVTSGNSSDDRNATESLTALGLHLAKLPVDARVGKMLIFGAVFKCTDVILTIAACLSASKSPFASSFNDDQQAKAAHAKFSNPHSDFLTFVNLWEAFNLAEECGKGRQLCKDAFLNYSALKEIQDARHHYLELLCGLGFLDRTKLGYDYRKRTFDEKKLASSHYCSSSGVEEVVHSVVCGGLYPNVASVTRKNIGGEVSVTHKTERLYIHSSVNSKLPRQMPSNWITFFEKFGTDRRVSISKTAFVSPFCLMLFGSELQVLHTERIVLVDGWIELPVAANTAVIFREVRNRVDSLLVALIEDSSSPSAEKAEEVIVKIVKLLSQG